MFTNQELNPSFTIEGTFQCRLRQGGGNMITDVVLVDIIRAAQIRNNDAMLILLNRFERLLNKYARELNMEYQDAKQELTLSFILLIRHLDLSTFRDTSNGSIVSYVAKAMHRAYVSISKKSKRLFTEISIDDVDESLQTDHFSFDSYMNVYIDEIKTCLTEREFFIFCLHCLRDEPIEKIAQKLGMSRQMTNRVKGQALQKLRYFYKDIYPNDLH